MFATQTLTKLSLYEFAQALGLSTLHVAGVEVDAIKGAYCSRPWIQYAWQDADRVSREDIGRAIKQAEDQMEQYLGFRLLPAFEADERHQTTGPFRPEFVNLTGRGVGGFNASIRTRWGYVIDYGRRATTQLTIIPQVIGMNPPADLTWLTAGYWELGEIVVDATGITDPQEIRLFYPGKGPDPLWEIRPTTVVINAITHQATVTFPRELGVLESIWNALVPGAAAGDDDADFISTADVFRVYADETDQAAFLWERVSNCATCGGNDPDPGPCPACGFRTAAGCLSTRGDPRLGSAVFRPAKWNTTTLQFDPADFPVFRMPDDIDINYLAGWQDPTRKAPRLEMADQWKMAVTYFAASLLERPPCDCSPDHWERWREDMTSTVTAFGAGGNIVRASQKDLTNPFGTRRGAIYAWDRVTDGAGIGKSASYV
jgi:hypothetical protein